MHVALHAVVYALGTALGVLLLLGVAYPSWIPDVAAWLPTTGGIATLSSIAGVLLAAPVLHFMVWWARSLRSREISYTTDNGRIAVSLIAIEEALTRALEGEPEVKKAHVRVMQDRVKNAVLIDAVMTLWEVPNVTERNRFCQRLLRRRFAELMPEQSAVQVNLSVHRLNVRRPEDRPTPAVVAGAVPVATTPMPANRPTAPVIDDDDLPVPGEDDDGLYVGPTYPVPPSTGEDEDDWQSRPPTTRVAKRK
jgi:hypothetical protein